MAPILSHAAIIAALRVSGTAYAVWPVTSNVGVFRRSCYAILWLLYFANALSVMVGIITGLYVNTLDLVDTMKSVVEFTYISEAFFNLVYCRIRRSQLKVLLSEIEELDKSWIFPEEKSRWYNYLERTQLVYTVLPVIFTVGALIFVFSPLVMPQRIIPLNTVYLLPMDESWGLGVSYALNIFSILQASVAITVDLMVVAILWYATFKFDLVGMKMRNIENEWQLREYIVLHQRSINYAKQADCTVSIIVVKSTAAVSIYIISCSLLILNNIPVFELMQFFLITFLSGLRVYVCSWTAQTMTDTAYDITWKLYEASWVNSSQKMRKDVLMIIQRCQRPIIITASGIIPALSLRFCASVLYKAFSYFMTLRAILHV